MTLNTFWRQKVIAKIKEPPHIRVTRFDLRYNKDSSPLDAQRVIDIEPTPLCWIERTWDCRIVAIIESAGVTRGGDPCAECKAIWVRCWA